MDGEMNLFQKLSLAEDLPQEGGEVSTRFAASQEIMEHKMWLRWIRHELPSMKKPFKVGIYIRYFNQTKYDNYLDFHVRQYKDTIALCPNWELVDFYVDEGAVAPNMESAPEWCRLLNDCFSGKVNLIMTQKVSNVSKKHYEITLIARILAALEKPVGIYFISEDIYTLASYYSHDLRDDYLFPTEDWVPLPDDEREERLLLTGGEQT